MKECGDDSIMNLSERELTDDDLIVVVNEALVKKLCKELWLQANKITSKGALTIANALRDNTTLDTLYLRDNHLNNEGVYFLAQALSLNGTNVKNLGLGGNGITDEGVSFVAEMLKSNTKLRVLYLRHNQIGDQGIKVLADVLSFNNTTLKELYLSSNPLVTDLSGGYLLKMLQHNLSLKRLWVHNLNFSEETKAKFQKVKEEKTVFDLSI